MSKKDVALTAVVPVPPPLDEEAGPPVDTLSSNGALPPETQGNRARMEDDLLADGNGPPSSSAKQLSWVGTQTAGFTKASSSSQVMQDNFVSIPSKPSTRSDVQTREVVKEVRLPSFMRTKGKNSLLVSLALTRARRFGIVSCMVLVAGLAWAAVRFYLMIDGENQVSTDNFKKMAASIARSMESELTRDLIYQDMIANIWCEEPHISRTKFRSLVMSEAYAPGLETMTGISLIPRVMGSDARQALESHPDSERLRLECCEGSNVAGEMCMTVAADGLFCREEADHRFQFTQFGANGLEPAVGNSSEYLDRVGREEYMVVDIIEPFNSNSKVWGFNLLSSDARLSAWRSAMSTGQKTFTRRLNLVQSTSAEFGVLVWLPVFKKADDSWTTGLDGRVHDLEAVGSVNGVFRVQYMFSKALSGTFSKEQLGDTKVFVFDNADELKGKAQFLAYYGSDIPGSYERYGEATMADVQKDAWMASSVDITIRGADAKWTVVVVADSEYLGKRRSNNPWYALVISVMVIIGGTFERWLGHPAFALKYLSSYDSGAGAMPM